MATRQLIPGLVLATMVFPVVVAVALELRLFDFTRVARTPRTVFRSLILRFVLLPVGTCLAPLVPDLARGSHPGRASEAADAIIHELPSSRPGHSLGPTCRSPE